MTDKVANLVDQYMDALSQAPPEVYRIFTAKAFAYFGLTLGSISVIENDESPHKIKTPAIRNGDVLYEGPVRVGQLIVLTQKRYFRELLTSELESNL